MEYTEDQLTGWITGVPPERDGVYEVNTGSGLAYWSKVKGWGGGASTVDSAACSKAWGSDKDFYHTDGRAWRGLNHNPDAPVKQKSAGNKRKTMYVVVAFNHNGPTPMAAFSNMSNAKQYAKGIGLSAIKRIRFRTPEHN